MPITTTRVYKDDAGKWRWKALDAAGKEYNSTKAYSQEWEAIKALKIYLSIRRKFEK